MFSSFGVTYTDVNEPDPGLCSGDDTESSDERAAGLEQISNGGDFIISAWFDYSEIGLSNCVANEQTIIPGTYLSMDLVGIRVEPSADISWAANFMNCTGIDFFSPVRVSGNNGYFLGSTKQDANFTTYNGVQDENTVVNSILKVDLTSGDILWSRNFSDGYLENCPFGLTLSSDAGIVIGGNNENNDEDYLIMRLHPDCQMDIEYTGTYDIPNGMVIDGNLYGSQTWTNDCKVKGIVRITDGYSLTINGAEVQFASSQKTNDFDYLAGNDFSSPTGDNSQPTKIIVEPGARLIIGDCILKGLDGGSGCYDDMWEGIEVWGDPNSVQNQVNQGYVSITDNAAVLQDMVMGIVADKMEYNANGNAASLFTFGGGVIYTDGGTFENCRKSIGFSPYNFAAGQNASIIQSTLFHASSPMIDINYTAGGQRLGVNSFISIYGVTPFIKISNCRFKNESTIDLQDRGVGIAASEALFYVSGNDDPNDPDFLNLARGIDAHYALMPQNTFSAGYCTFDNVLKGVTVTGGFGTSISHCTFNNIPNSHPVAPYFTYGVRLDGAHAYSIDHNVFAGNTSPQDFYIQNNGVIADGTDGPPSQCFQNVM